MIVIVLVLVICNLGENKITMTGTIFYKCPNLIIEHIQDGFYCVFNPNIRNGIKILNSFQLQVLNQFDGNKPTNRILKTNDISDSIGSKLLEILKKKQFISEADRFNTIIAHKNSFSSLNLWIHTTDDCNLVCKYCYIKTKSTKRKISTALMQRLRFKLVETVRKRDLKLVTLRLAGGEPFIEFEHWKDYLIELKNCINELGCILKVIFLTNLTLLSNDIMDYIAAHNIGIGVSLDGLGNYHDSARCFSDSSGSYDRVNRNILRLLDNNISPSIMTVVSNDNLRGLLDLTKFLVEKRLSFRYSIVHGNSLQYDIASRMFNECYQYFERQIENGYPFSKLFKLCDLKFNDVFYQTCGSGINTGALYHDGNIYFCQKLVGSGKYIDSIYSSDDIVTIISKAHNKYGTISSECQQCDYTYICTGGCPLDRTNKNKSPSCAFYKEYIPNTMRLIGKERLEQLKRKLDSTRSV